MRLLAALLSALLIPAVLPCPAADKGPVITVADNGSIVRTVRCHVAAGTSPSLITQQADKLYEERNHACQKASASK